MQRVNYETSPYSFGTDRHFITLLNNEKQFNEIQTNEHSDTSDVIMQVYNNNNIKNTRQEIQSQSAYSSLIRSMSEEMEYHKEALRTAQNLIINYQKQNENLKQQSINSKQQLQKVTAKLESVQRLLFKLFHLEPETSSIKTPIKRLITVPSKFPNNKNQTPQTFRINNIEDNNEKQIAQQSDLYQRLEQIYKQQLLYQEQIFQLNNKIKLLEKHAYVDMKSVHKNKLKSSHYVPFVGNQSIGEEKMKITSKLTSLYSIENTPKTNPKKQSQFKKNLEKQFQVFLQNKKAILKIKASASRVPIFTSSHSKSSQSISFSTQKRKSSTKRSMSIPKK